MNINKLPWEEATVNIKDFEEAIKGFQKDLQSAEELIESGYLTEEQILVMVNAREAFKRAITDLEKQLLKIN